MATASPQDHQRSFRDSESVVMGSIISSVLMGIQVLAICQYGARFNRDRWFFKITVILLFLISFISWCFGIFGGYAVSGPITPSYQHTLWNLEVTISCLTCLSALLSQLFFGRRVVNLGGISKKYVPLFLYLMLVPVIVGFVSIIGMKPTDRIKPERWRLACLELALWVRVAIDVTLTSALVWRLRKDLKRARTSNSVKESLIRRIALIAFTTGFLSTFSTAFIAISNFFISTDSAYPDALTLIHPHIYSLIVCLSLNLRGDTEGWKGNHGNNNHNNNNNNNNNRSNNNNNHLRDTFFLGDLIIQPVTTRSGDFVDPIASSNRDLEDQREHLYSTKNDFESNVDLKTEEEEEEEEEANEREEFLGWEERGNGRQAIRARDIVPLRRLSNSHDSNVPMRERSRRPLPDPSPGQSEEPLLKGDASIMSGTSVVRSLGSSLLDRNNSGSTVDLRPIPKSSASPAPSDSSMWHSPESVHKHR